MPEGEDRALNFHSVPCEDQLGWAGLGQARGPVIQSHTGCPCFSEGVL